MTSQTNCRNESTVGSISTESGQARSTSMPLNPATSEHGATAVAKFQTARPPRTGQPPASVRFCTTMRCASLQSPFRACNQGAKANRSFACNVSARGLRQRFRLAKNFPPRLCPWGCGFGTPHGRAFAFENLRPAINSRPSQPTVPPRSFTTLRMSVAAIFSPVSGRGVVKNK